MCVSHSLTLSTEVELLATTEMSSSTELTQTAATAVFKALDSNEDGRVNVVEFLGFSKKLYNDETTQEDLLQHTRDIIGLADGDSDDSLDLQEWLRLVDAWDNPNKLDFLNECRAEALQLNALSGTPNQTLLDFERGAITKEVFDALDVNHTGTVDHTELTLLVEMLNLRDVSVMMRQLDLDRDGFCLLYTSDAADE